jgi:aspartokinase/homoserine dehydrogenase 1
LTVASLCLLGRGNVGSNLLRILGERGNAIREHHGVELRVAAVAGRGEAVLDPRGLDPRSWRERPTRPTDARALLREIAGLEHPVLVDVTAISGADDLYALAFELGVHVVTANKNALAAPLDAYQALMRAARAGKSKFFYETTVGADLPVLAPIADRVRSGDRIFEIEGSLSGTLGFLADKVSSGADLAGAVADAKERGYTEPDPAEDLSGRDVARKALILARELGLALSIEDVELEPFVPQATLDAANEIGLDAALAAAAPLFAHRCERLRREGTVLRYLAQVAPGSAVPLRVGPVVVDASHPAAQLRGTEALVCVRTDRSGDMPLVVRGPGAGGSATASGVLADVLRAVG